MPEFIVPPEILQKPLDPNQYIYVNGDAIPGWRNTIAYRKGTRNNLLIRTSGGIGDQICCEPVIRWAIEELGYTVSLTAPLPELYQHLYPKLKLVHNYNKDAPLKFDPYYIVDLMAGPESLALEFHSPMAMHCVDYPSVCGFRSQMPLSYKAIELHPSEEDCRKVDELLTNHCKGKPYVLIHPGRHWIAKTFPSRWWNHVIRHVSDAGVVPVLIGGHGAAKKDLMERSTVDVNPELCVDFRCKLSIMESIALCQRAQVLITNDSAPLHMAASGYAWIGFLTLAKHPEHLMHYRKRYLLSPEYGWRMENLSLGGFWQKQDITRIDASKLEPKQEWLPEPKVVADWALGRLV